MKLTKETIDEMLPKLPYSRSTIEDVVAVVPEQGNLTDEQRDTVEDAFVTARDERWESAAFINYLESHECFERRPHPRL